MGLVVSFSLLRGWEIRLPLFFGAVSLIVLALTGRSLGLHRFYLLAVWSAVVGVGAALSPVSNLMGGALFWLALGLGFLTKGPGVFFDTAVPMLVWPWLAPARRWRKLPWWAGPVLFLAVAAPWPVLVLASRPEAGSVWWTELATRSDPLVHHLRPLYYYLARLPVLTFPWIVLTVGGCVAFFLREAGTEGVADGARGRLARLRRRVEEQPLTAYAMLWFVGALFCWSLIGQKKVNYLVPALPAAALLAADACRYWYRHTAEAGPRLGAALQAVVHLVVVGAAVWTVRLRPAWLPWSAAIGGCNLLAALVLLLGRRRGGRCARTDLVFISLSARPGGFEDVFTCQRAGGAPSAPYVI